MAALKFFLSLLLYPLTLLIASAGILAFLAVWTDPAESGLITWAGLVMPAILLANLCAAIYWIFRKSGWASVPLAVILLNSGYLTSIFQISSPVPVSPHDTTVIRIASYNVGGFRSWEKQDTYYPIAAYFREQQVNIACFQEYSEKTKLKADSLSKLLGLPYHTVEYLPGSTASGSAIYSKFPILSHGRLPFASKSNDAMWADIRINGQTIRVVSCHLETTNFYSKRKALKKKGVRQFRSSTTLLRLQRYLVHFAPKLPHPGLPSRYRPGDGGYHFIAADHLRRLQRSPFQLHLSAGERRTQR